MKDRNIIIEGVRKADEVMTLKRILLFIILLLMGSNVCLAEDKYEIRYRWYKEEIVGDYLLEDTLNKYQYKDNNKYIYSDYIDDFKLLDNTVDLNDETREYDFKTIYYYKKPMEINCVNLGNFSDLIDIEEVNIYYKDIPISYGTANLRRADWDDTRGSFNQNSFISFCLDKYYEPKDISVEIITSPTDSTVNFEIRYAIGFNDVSDENVIKHTVSNKESKYIPSNDWEILRYNNKIYESDRREISDELYGIDKMNVYYRYRNKLIYYYNVNRRYYDDNYYANMDGYLPDYNDYKVYSNSNESNNNEVKIIDNTTVNTTNIRKNFSKDMSSINSINTVNNLIRDNNTNKYLIVSSIIISLTIIGIGLIGISCKKCRTN